MKAGVSQLALYSAAIWLEIIKFLEPTLGQCIWLIDARKNDAREKRQRCSSESA